MAKGQVHTPTSHGRKNSSGKKPFVRNRKKSGLQQDLEEIARLEEAIAAGAPPKGSNPLSVDLKESGEDKQQVAEQKSGKTAVARNGSDANNEGEEAPKAYVGVKQFKDLPISERTKRSLALSRFATMTAIQRASLPHALCGRDVLGAAKTGSGKTLAFLIPILERLYRMRWGHEDGIGALIISPTRELALQIFGELQKAGAHHSFSAGLLIGGKEVKEEKIRVNTLNIIVCTPGRLLQHMDETPNFDCSNLQMLVLDEADRILDLGFARALNAIVANLPRERQTLLFSATQTKSVRDLARLSLKEPEYIAVHDKATVATPAKLQQTVMVVPLGEKLDLLWSFIRTHIQAKILVFLSTCKQAKFVHEAFSKLRPGVPLKLLTGRLKQMKRMITFKDFCEAKNAVLFATDVAARGLDFPAVDWVVQVDCPEDVAAYIHRVGRTARYTASGRSLLMLSPSERNMLPALQAAKVPVKVTKPNLARVQRISQALGGLLSKSPELKYMAQRAFVTYIRSIHVQPNKEVFDVTQLPVLEYATSLGLPNAPRIRFLKKGVRDSSGLGSKGGAGGAAGPRSEPGGSSEEEDAGGESGAEDMPVGNGGSNGIGGNKKRAGGGLREGDGEDAGGEGEGRGEKRKRSKMERLFARKNADVLSAAYGKLRGEDEEEDEELLRVKRVNHRLDGEEEEARVGAVPPVVLPVKSKKKKKLKIDPGRAGNNRMIFDESGEALPPLAALGAKGDATEDNLEGGIAAAAAARFRKLQEEMRQRDKEDRRLEKERLRERRQKAKSKAAAREEGGDEPIVTLGRPDNEDEDYDVSMSETDLEGKGTIYRSRRAGPATKYQSDSEDGGSFESYDYEGEEDGDEVVASAEGGRKDGKKGRAGSISVAEQETLALRLLGAKK